MNISKNVNVTARQYTDVNTPLAGMRETDRITGTFNQDTEDYFIITSDFGDLEVSLGSWIVEFTHTDGTLVARTVVPDSKYKILFGV